MNTKANKQGRPGMTINPLLGGMGLAARGQSVVDAVAATTPAASKAVEDWAKEPAERVAASIEEKPAEAAVSVPSVEPTQTLADAEINAQKAAAEASSDDFVSSQEARGRNLKPWADKEKEIRNDVGNKGKPSNFRLSADIYAKTWFLKEITPGMTWDKVAEMALERFVNRKLKELGYEV